MIYLLGIFTQEKIQNPGSPELNPDPGIKKL